MESANDLLSPKGGQNLEGSTEGKEKENEMRGLFFDLLASLAGGDHPSLPQGHKLKPMTGFSAILDAFNENNKIQEASSGIIQEISSKEFMSQSRSDTSTSNQNADSSVSVPSSNTLMKGLDSSAENSSQRESSSAESRKESLVLEKPSESDIPPQTSSSSRETTPVEDQPESNYSDVPELHMQIRTENLAENETKNESSDTLFASLSEEANVDSDRGHTQAKNLDGLKIDQRLPLDSDNYEDAKEENQNWIIDVNGNEVSLEAADYKSKTTLAQATLEETRKAEVSTMEDTTNLNPTQSKGKYPREIREIEEELSKYSNQIRELEKILKENITVNPSQSLEASQSNSFHPGGDMLSGSNPRRLIEEGGLVKSFADGAVSPNSFLEMMYDANSPGSQSPHNLPASAYLSTYQSCMSLASNHTTTRSHATTLINNSLGSIIHTTENPISKTDSLYMDCVSQDLDQELVDDNILLKKLNPLRASFSTKTFSEERLKSNLVGPEKAKKHMKHSVKIIDSKNMEANDENSESYYSVDDATSEEEAFQDCSDNDKSHGSHSKAPLKKRKKKRRQLRKRASSSSSHSASERLWTSASASEPDVAGQRLRFYDADEI